MNFDALTDKLAALTGDDQADAIRKELRIVQDACEAALVPLARLAHGDPKALDAMEELALSADRLSAVACALEIGPPVTDGHTEGGTR